MVRDNHCSHRARERAIEERMLHDREEEDESSHHAAQPGAELKRMLTDASDIRRATEIIDYVNKNSTNQFEPFEP